MPLLDFVLKTTYFSFRDQIYKQIYKQNFGTAIGSPVHVYPIVCNILNGTFRTTGHSYSLTELQINSLVAVHVCGRLSGKLT